MTKIVHPDETLNIYYRVSEDTNELKDIVTVKDDENDDITSSLNNLNNVQKIQWSPDAEEHLYETFEFDIDSIYEKQNMHVNDRPDRGLLHSYNASINSNIIKDVDEWKDSKNDLDLITGSTEGLGKINNNQAIKFNNSQNDELIAQNSAPELSEYSFWIVLEPSIIDSDSSNPFYISENDKGFRIQVRDDGIGATHSGEFGFGEIDIPEEPVIYGQRYSSSSGWEHRALNKNFDKNRTGSETGMNNPQGDDIGIGIHDGRGDKYYDGKIGHILLYNKRQNDNEWEKTASSLLSMWF